MEQKSLIDEYLKEYEEKKSSQASSMSMPYDRI